MASRDAQRGAPDRRDRGIDITACRMLAPRVWARVRACRSVHVGHRSAPAVPHDLRETGEVSRASGVVQVPPRAGLRTHREDTSLTGPSAGAEPASRPFATPGTASALSPEAMAWADDVVEALRTDYLFQHVAVFLISDDGRLVLAGQRWGAGEDVGGVV